MQLSYMAEKIEIRVNHYSRQLAGFFNNPLLYIRAKAQEPFYLLSYRKSGNTWLRGLLECYLKVGSRNLEYRLERSIINNTMPEKIYKIHQWDSMLKPNLKIIYIIRDPREVLLSLYLWDHFKIDSSINPYEIVKYVNTGFFAEEAKNLCNHVSKTADHRCLVIRYEDISNINTWEKIADYLHFNLNKSQLENCLNMVNKSFTAKYHSYTEKYIQSPNLPNNNKWKRFLSNSQIATIERECGPVMEWYGYV